MDEYDCLQLKNIKYVVPRYPSLRQNYEGDYNNQILYVRQTAEGRNDNMTVPENDERSSAPIDTFFCFISTSYSQYSSSDDQGEMSRERLALTAAQF